MNSKSKPQSRKKHSLLWAILIIAVLAAGVFGVYSRLYLKPPPPAPKPAVVTGKIPPMATAQPVQSSETPPQSADTMQAVGEEGRKVPSDIPPPGVDSNMPEINPTDPGVQGRAEGIEESTAQRTPIREVVPATAGQSGMDESRQPESADSQVPAAHQEVSRSMAAVQVAPQPAAPPATSDRQPPEPEAERQTAGPLGANDRQAPEPGADRQTAAQSSETAPAPSAPPEVSKPQEEPESSAPYTIQVGAFLKKANADRTLSQLTKKGYDAYIFQQVDKKRRMWHMVRFGHFQDLETASLVMKAFKGQEKIDAAVVRSKSE